MLVRDGIRSTRILYVEYRERVIKSLDARRLCIVKVIFSDPRPCNLLNGVILCLPFA